MSYNTLAKHNTTMPEALTYENTTNDGIFGASVFVACPENITTYLEHYNSEILLIVTTIMCYVMLCHKP